MQSQLATKTGLRDRPPQPTPISTTNLPRRVTLLDRAALQLGVALIRWGRRPATRIRRERPELTFEAEHARQERERLWESYKSLTMTRFR
jgi:hypothetical protein